MSRKKTRGRSSLSFQLDDGILDVDHILQTDPWGAVENIAKSEIGSIQSLLDEFNDKMLDTKQLAKGRDAGAAPRKSAPLKSRGSSETEMTDDKGTSGEKRRGRSVGVKQPRKTNGSRQPAKTDQAFTRETKKKAASDISREKNNGPVVAAGKGEKRSTQETKKTVRSTTNESRNDLEGESRSIKSGKDVKSEKLRRGIGRKNPRKRWEERNSADFPEMRLGTSTPKKTLSGSNVSTARTVPANVIVKTETRELSNTDCDDRFARATQEESFSTKSLNNNEYEHPAKFRENERKSTSINNAGESIDARRNIGRREGKESGRLPKIRGSAGKRSPDARLPANSARKVPTTHEGKTGESEKRLVRVGREERRVGRAFEEFARRVAKVARTMGYLADNSSSDESSSSSSSACSDSSCSCCYSYSCSCSGTCSSTSCSSCGTDEYSEYTLNSESD